MRNGKQIQRITVIGIGNTLMGDDGIGVAVVQNLLPIISSSDFAGLDIGVVIGGTAGMGLVRYFRESDVVLVVDAIDIKTEPGAVFRFTPDEADIVRLRSNNIHGMGVPHLVANARLVGANPEIIVFAVQVGEVRPRDGVLTPLVEAAVKRVGELVMEELQSRCSTKKLKILYLPFD